MANLLVVMFEKKTALGGTVQRKARFMGKPIVFNGEQDAAEFMAERFDVKFETRKASRADILYGVPSSKLN